MTERPGTLIGPYKLLQQIGEGGMGTVVMAEQTQPVQRKVALKVIKAGMDSRQVIARFEAERQALAMMDHINIARVLDAGATESGRPYFVMELVHGVPITKYCDDNRLTPRQRLELFVPVCQAIQHAHQKGIIHRDVKPSNVMITLYDGKPVPKVIDFGVAKAIEQKLTERTLFTQYGTLVGTLEYMSPEQAEMSALGVDTRSDIYSLGALLYELLTGSTPLSHQRVREAAYAEILRLIKEEEPPRPSTRLTDSGEALASISSQRQMEPAKLTKLVRGELDWIVMKTLEKDRNRRYETANGLARDIEHYLNDEAVQACPPSAWYRFRKFARRNKRALATAVLLGLMLIAAVFGLAVSNRLISRQRDDADRQRKLARQAVDKMFTQVAEKWLAHNASLEPLQKQFLQDALHFYEEFAKEQHSDPELRLETANAFRRMGEVHHKLGESAESEKAFRQAHAILEKLVAEFPSEANYRSALAASYHQNGFMLRFSDREREAADMFRQAVMHWEKLVADGPEVPEYRRGLATSLGGAANMLSSLGSISESIDAYRRALALLENLPPDLANEPEVRYELGLMNSELADTLNSHGRTPESEPYFYTGKAAYEKLVSELPREPLYRNELAWAVYSEGKRLAGTRPRDAEKAYHRALEIEEKLVSESPTVPDYQFVDGRCYQALGDLLRQAGRIQEAEDAFRRAIQVLEKLITSFPRFRPTAYGESRLASLNSLGALLSASGRTKQAEQVYTHQIHFVQKLAAANPEVADYRDQLVQLYSSSGQWEKAIAECTQAIELKPDRWESWYWRGCAYMNQQLRDKALTNFSKAVELNPQRTSPWLLADAWRHRAEIYVVLGELDKGVAGFTTAIELDPGNPWHWLRRGQAYARLQQWPKTVADCTRTIELNADFAEPWQTRGEAHAALGQWDKAVADYAKVIELNPAACAGLTDQLKAKGRTREAEEVYRQAIAFYERHAASKPDKTEFRLEAAMKNRDLGQLLNETSQQDKAERSYRRSIEILENLAAEFPTNSKYNEQLGHDYCDLASCLPSRDKDKEREQLCARP